jgi:hypothetical protein
MAPAPRQNSSSSQGVTCPCPVSIAVAREGENNAQRAHDNILGIGRLNFRIQSGTGTWSVLPAGIGLIIAQLMIGEIEEGQEETGNIARIELTTDCPPRRYTMIITDGGNQMPSAAGGDNAGGEPTS